MKRLFTAVALAATVAIPTVAVVPSASADTLTCVSRNEYRAVKMGWSMPRVHGRFDVKGQQSYLDANYQDRQYRACTDWGMVFVSYEKEGGKWRVISKAAYW